MDIKLSEIDAYLAGSEVGHKHCREILAKWMIDRGFSTGHGDSIADLLRELSWQIDELRKK